MTGGGFHFTTSLGTQLTNVEITGNYAKSDGGGFYFTTGHQQVFKNCLIADNYSGGNGGGVYAAAANNQNRTRQYINTTVTGNYAAGSGGGVYLTADANLTFINSIVSDNYKKGTTDPQQSDLWLSGGDVNASKATHSLIGVTENTGKITFNAPSDGLRNQDPIFLRPVDMQGLSGSIASDCVITRGTTSTGDDFVLGNYHQMEGSPIIDAGVNDSIDIDFGDPPLDMDGRPRIQGNPAIVDLGPYEGTGENLTSSATNIAFP